MGETPPPENRGENGGCPSVAGDVNLPPTPQNCPPKNIFNPLKYGIVVGCGRRAEGKRGQFQGAPSRTLFFCFLRTPFFFFQPLRSRREASRRVLIIHQHENEDCIARDPNRSVRIRLQSLPNDHDRSPCDFRGGRRRTRRTTRTRRRPIIVERTQTRRPIERRVGGDGSGGDEDTDGARGASEERTEIGIRR
jgi:hypothetical protein